MSKSERGVLPKKVKDKRRLFDLLLGHRRMALHEKMWREGFREGSLLPTDFEDEPDNIKEFVKPIYTRVFVDTWNSRVAEKHKTSVGDLRS